MSPENEGRLRIASYNIHRAIGRDRCCKPQRIAQVIEELGCDTVGLQEVTSRPGDADGQSEAMQVEYIAQVTGMRAVPGRRINRYDGDYGNVLFTRRPVLSVEHHDLTVARREPRSALDVELDVDGTRTRVILTHLGLGPFERRKQVKRILLAVTTTPTVEPVILLGDINEWLPRGPLRWLHAEFGTPPAPRSFPSRFPLVAFDRIWVRPRKALLSVAVHRSETARIASDHLPIVAEVSVRQESAAGSSDSTLVSGWAR